MFFSSALVLDSPRLSPFYNKLERFGWRIVKQELPVRFDEIAEGSIQQRQTNKITHTHSTLLCIIHCQRVGCFYFCKKKIGYYKQNLNKSGCCGMDEFVKLGVYEWEQYQRV